MIKFRVYYSDGAVGYADGQDADDVRRQSERLARSMGLAVNKIKRARGDTVATRSCRTEQPQQRQS